MSEASIPEMLTAEDVAKVLKVSYHSALGFIKYSGIAYIKVGNQYRVNSEKLAEYLSKKGKQSVNLQ